MTPEPFRVSCPRGLALCTANRAKSPLRAGEPSGDPAPCLLPGDANGFGRSDPAVLVSTRRPPPLLFDVAG